MFSLAIRAVIVIGLFGLDTSLMLWGIRRTFTTGSFLVEAISRPGWSRARRRRPRALRGVGKIPDGSLFELGTPSGPVGSGEGPAELCASSLRRTLRGADTLCPSETL